MKTPYYIVSLTIFFGRILIYQSFFLRYHSVSYFLNFFVSQ